jgi:hypothetical protein
MFRYSLTVGVKNPVQKGKKLANHGMKGKELTKVDPEEF